MEKVFRWGFVVVIFIAVFWWLAQEELVSVKVTSPEVGTVESTVSNTRSGTITACQRAKMSLPIGGQIEHIHVREGQLVQQGEVLLSLWNQDKLALLAESKAKAKAIALEAESQCISARHDRKEAQRQQTLFDQKLTSQESLDGALAKAESAETSCLAANANHKAMLSMVAVVEAHLEQTYLKAPFTGIVAEVTGEVGEFTTPSPPGVATPPAVDLLTHNCHYITAPIDEVDAARIKPGMPVHITIDAFKAEQIAGTVRRIAPYVQDFEKQARTVTIEVDIVDSRSAELLAGYSADVEVVLASKNNTLYLPSDLIVEKQFVYIVNKQNIVEKRAVTIGLENWNITEIVQGLTKNDRVVVSIGKQGIAEGAHVMVEPNE